MYSATDIESMTIAEGDDKMGLLGGDWGELHFDNCVIPESQRLSEEGQGFKLFMNSLNIGRISIGAISLGLAQACLAAAIDYARQRKQFNKPIADFQAIQFKLADMALKIEAARNLVYNAARLKEDGKDFALEASMPVRRIRRCFPLCKVRCTKICAFAAWISCLNSRRTALPLAGSVWVKPRCR